MFLYIPCRFRPSGLAIGQLPIERDTRDDQSRKYKLCFINIILAKETAGYTETRVLIYHTLWCVDTVITVLAVLNESAAKKTKLK